MKNSLIHIRELNTLLLKDFQAEDPQMFFSEDEETLKRKLAQFISYLLDKDMNRLLAIFYRIDLREDKVRNILTKSPVEEISSRLADLVIDREMQKVKTRLKYRDSSS